MYRLPQLGCDHLARPIFVHKTTVFVAEFGTSRYSLQSDLFFPTHFPPPYSLPPHYYPFCKENII